MYNGYLLFYVLLTYLLMSSNYDAMIIQYNLVTNESLQMNNDYLIHHKNNRFTYSFTNIILPK